MDIHPTDRGRGDARSARRSAPQLADALPELLSLHGPRMLVVEDDRDLEPVVRRAAAAVQPAVWVDWCTRVDHARRLLRLRYYDVVLADYQLEGNAAGLALRGDCSELQPQAVFAMTSSYPLSDYLHSVGRPGSPFLAKPFDVWTCRQFVESLLVHEDAWSRR
jgi:DNA-binding NtrC family response regulator